MLSATGLLTALAALVIAVFLALCLPVWACLGLVFALVLIVAIGGAVLLAKVLVICALGAAAVSLWRRHGPRE